MSDSKEITTEIISRFEIELSGKYSLEDLKKALFIRILELLDNNVERLLSMLYRVDLSQKKLDDIFRNESKEEIAMNIAEAVIERQMQKIKTREYYKKNESGLTE